MTIKKVVDNTSTSHVPHEIKRSISQNNYQPSFRGAYELWVNKDPRFTLNNSTHFTTKSLKHLIKPKEIDT